MRPGCRQHAFERPPSPVRAWRHTHAGCEVGRDAGPPRARARGLRARPPATIRAGILPQQWEGSAARRWGTRSESRARGQTTPLSMGRLSTWAHSDALSLLSRPRRTRAVRRGRTARASADPGKGGGGADGVNAPCRGGRELRRQSRLEIAFESPYPSPSATVVRPPQTRPPLQCVLAGRARSSGSRAGGAPSTSHTLTRAHLPS